MCCEVKSLGDNCRSFLMLCIVYPKMLFLMWEEGLLLVYLYIMGHFTLQILLKVDRYTLEKASLLFSLVPSF